MDGIFNGVLCDRCSWVLCINVLNHEPVSLSCENESCPELGVHYMLPTVRLQRTTNKDLLKRLKEAGS